MHPDVITIIVSILIPLIGGFGWIISRMDKRFTELKKDIEEIHRDLRQIDVRLSRLEGGFTERGYWESREKKIGE